jgi:hypothetical protein
VYYLPKRAKKMLLVKNNQQGRKFNVVGETPTTGIIYLYKIFFFSLRSEIYCLKKQRSFFNLLLLISERSEQNKKKIKQNQWLQLVLKKVFLYKVIICFLL